MECASPGIWQLSAEPSVGRRYHQSPRVQNYLGVVESKQDEIERTMSYLGMQPPGADVARKRQASNLLRSFTPESSKRPADGSRLHHSSAPSPGSNSRKRAADDDLPFPTTPGSSNKAAAMFSLHHSYPRTPGSNRKRAKMYTSVHVDGIDNSRLSHQFIPGIRNSLEWDGGFLSPNSTDPVLHAKIEIYL